MSPILPSIGDPVESFDTPCLVIDEAALDHNLQVMARFGRKQGVAIRPHFKGHMCVAIAKRQMELGAIGLCVAKVSAAEPLVEAGVSDVLVANQVVTQKKIERLAHLAGRANIKVIVSEACNLADLSRAAASAGVTIGVLVELRCRSASSTFNKGVTRNGVDDPQAAYDLALQVIASAGLRFDGLMGYEGPHPYLEDDARSAQILKDLEKLNAVKQRLSENSVDCSIVTVGSTSTYRISGAAPFATEVQPGVYPLMDAQEGPLAPEFKYALSVLTTVTGRPTPDTAIVDIGGKSLRLSDPDPTDQTIDRPLILNPNGAALVHLSEEHGALALSGAGQKLKTADKVMMIPGRVGMTVNLYRHYFVCRDGILTDIWKIDAAGTYF